MECKREEVPKPREGNQDKSSHFIIGEGNINLSGNRLVTTVYEIVDYTTNKDYALKKMKEGYTVKEV